MRNAWTTHAAVITISLLALFGCNDDQPSRSESRTAAVRADARAKHVMYECWDIFQVQPDGSEVDTGYNVCDAVPPEEIRAIPWRYTMSISVIRAGTTAEQIVTSLDGQPGSSVDPSNSVPDFISMTDFDNTAPASPTQEKPPDGDLRFHNGQRVSVGSHEYLTAMNFQVPAPPIVPPNVLNESPTFNFEVFAGDTIIVRARKQGLAESPGFLVEEVPSLFLEAALSVGGHDVTPRGVTSSDVANKTGFTFSYTVP